jgi:hypothetical protein
VPRIRATTMLGCPGGLSAAVAKWSGGRATLDLLARTAPDLLPLFSRQGFPVQPSLGCQAPGLPPNFLLLLFCELPLSRGGLIIRHLVSLLYQLATRLERTTHPRIPAATMLGARPATSAAAARA